MTSDLRQRLRTCSAEERRAVAMELAHAGTDETIEELIRMADGVKRYRSGSWRNLWRDIPVEVYTLEDQFDAIDALSETGSKTALKYLNRLLEHKIVNRKTDGYTQSDGQVLDVWEEGTIVFPRAKGELKEALSCRYYDGEGITQSGHTDEKDNPVYLRVEEAAKKLRSNL